MNVWVLSEGLLREGGEIIGIYASLEAAEAAKAARGELSPFWWRRVDLWEVQS